MTIRILPSNLINQIAAGEVIERPASVIKELVENSLDAGATKIKVELTDGGKIMIAITDNGRGMSREDLETSVERHATSKLPSDDLFNVKFFGFRGEALPSIASVSRMKITTRQEGDEFAWVLKVNGGIKEPIEAAGGVVGTTIEVWDLFYATPARLKFLKSDKSEVGACVDVMNRIALAHPEVTFQLYANDKLKLMLNAREGLGFEATRLERASDVMGKDFAGNCLEVSGERENMKITGLISLPTYNKASSLSEYFFVNNRPVRDKLLLGALKGAYSGVLEVSRYPACVLFVDVDPMYVDVNVHPTKAEVRFFDQQGVRSMVVGSIRQALTAGDKRSSDVQMMTELARMWKKSEETVADEPDTFYEKPAETYNQETGEVEDMPQFTPRPMTGFEKPTPYMPKATPIFQTKAPTPTFGTEVLPELSRKFSVRTEEPPAYNPEDIGPLGVAKAQFHDTYILAQAEDCLILVDQHAAHERIVLERLKASFINGVRLPSQMMLLPEVVPLSVSQKEALSGQFENLAKLGLVLEEFGNEIMVREVPAILREPNLKKMIEDLADEICEWGATMMVEDKINHIASTIACHGSVRAGRRMNVAEMNHLLREMEQTPHCAECNHGRPTYVKLEVSDLERLFHR